MKNSHIEWTDHTFRPCKKPACRGFAAPGSRHCAAHQPAARQEIAAGRARLDERRGTAASRGYGGSWPATARLLRTRCPLSPGYLTRTAYWTPALAAEFHALRETALAAGRYLEFLRSVSDWTLRSQLSTLNPTPIYEFHPSPLPEAAECVDHIVPVTGPADPLFFNPANHQPISHRQHSEKTATYDGGYGRPGYRPAPSEK